jgi:hypothetical protein
MTSQPYVTVGTKSIASAYVLLKRGISHNNIVDLSLLYSPGLPVARIFHSKLHTYSEECARVLIGRDPRDYCPLHVIGKY